MLFIINNCQEYTQCPVGTCSLQTARGTLRGWTDESQDSFLAKASYDLDSPSETWARARTPGIYYVDTDCIREKVLLGLGTIVAVF